MCAGRNVTTIYFAVTAGAVLVGLMLFAPWPLWTAFATAFTIFGLLLFRERNTRSQSKGSSPPAAFTYASAPASDVRAKRLTDVLLPSRSADYRFQFSAMVMWSPTVAETAESEANHAALAVSAIVERACELTELRDPGHASLVQHELAGALGEMRLDPTRRLHARAESVQLALPGPDQKRLDKLAEVRKEEAVWEHERKYEQNRRDYLQHDVLKDPGSAVVWWLAKNDDQVDRTVKDIGLIAQLASAANNTAVPQTFHPFLPRFTASDEPFANDLPTMNGSAAAASTGDEEPSQDSIEAFFEAMGFSHSDPRRRLLARQFAELVTKHGRQDVAEELIRRYDPPSESDAEQEGWLDGS